ncbi:MAG: polysaccharide pyruvyl transferase family protein [bacterium]
MMKILHIACHNTNVGDGALINGLQNSLRDIEPEIAFTNDDLMDSDNNWGHKRYDEAFFRRAEKNFDLIVIGGGGLFDSNSASDLSGMTLNVDPKVLGTIKVPVVFYAVGFNVFRGQGFHHADKLRRLVDRVLLLKDRVLLSVRNDGSKKRLERFVGHSSPDIIEIPDPGLYLKSEEASHPQIRQGMKNVLIQLAGDRAQYRFQEIGITILNRKIGLFRKNQNAFLRRLISVLRTCSKSEKINFILVPHIAGDLEIMRRFFALCPDSFTRYHFDVAGFVRGSAKAPAFFDLYRRADLILGMRGHSAICAAGLRRPFIALSSHDKIAAFMASCGLLRYSVEVLDSKFENKLRPLISELLGNPRDYVEQLQTSLSRFRQQTDEFNRRVLALARGGTVGAR